MERLMDISKLFGIQKSRHIRRPIIACRFNSVIYSQNKYRNYFVFLQADGHPDPKLYIWDVELDTVSYFNFDCGRGEQDEYMANQTATEDVSEADK